MSISTPVIAVSNRPLAWGIGYIVAQCTDTPNLIFAIKQGGLGENFRDI